MNKKILSVFFVLMMTFAGATNANAGFWDFVNDTGNAIEGAANSSSAWVRKANADLNTAINRLGTDFNRAAAESYFWAFDTGNLVGDWTTNAAVSTWNSFGPLFGTVINTCPATIHDNGTGTSVRYNLTKFTPNAPNLCSATGGTKDYPILLSSGVSSNVKSYSVNDATLTNGESVNICDISNIPKFYGLPLTVSIPGVPNVVIPKLIFEGPTLDLSGLKQSFNVLFPNVTLPNLPSDPRRNLKLIKPACNTHIQCSASASFGASLAEQVAWQNKCDAELLGNLADIKLKFLAPFSIKGVYAALLANPLRLQPNLWTVSNPVTPPAVDLGVPMFRQAADVNGDGKTDYCRQVGKDKIACDTYDPTTREWSEVTSSTITDMGYVGSRWLADINGDGKDEYCREVGNRGTGANASYILCNGLGTSTRFDLHLSDMGYSGSRWFADVNGDGRDDYCREVGNRGTGSNASYVVCGGRDSFQRWNYIGRTHLKDLGYVGSRWFADVNGDGKDDYCREVGNRGTGINASFIRCRTATGGNFNTTFGFKNRGEERRMSKGQDVGYLDARWFADVNNDGNEDYCREVGDRGSTANPPYIRCTSLGSVGGGSAVMRELGNISSAQDIGYRHPRMFGDFTGDGQTDYLRTIGLSTSRKLAVLSLNGDPVADAGAVQTLACTGGSSANAT
ncbi:MAG: hypothetical protein R8K53_04415, partial [Mariprofundaceae bacterium]